jgi:hypothetical protein
MSLKRINKVRKQQEGRTSKMRIGGWACFHFRGRSTYCDRGRFEHAPFSHFEASFRNAHLPPWSGRLLLLCGPRIFSRFCRCLFLRVGILFSLPLSAAIVDCQ